VLGASEKDARNGKLLCPGNPVTWKGETQTSTHRGFSDREEPKGKLRKARLVGGGGKKSKIYSSSEGYREGKGLVEKEDKKVEKNNTSTHAMSSNLGGTSFFSFARRESVPKIWGRIWVLSGLWGGGKGEKKVKTLFKKIYPSSDKKGGDEWNTERGSNRRVLWGRF